MKSIKVFLNILFMVSLCCCVPDGIILPGDISGYVTDAEKEEPVESALVVLSTLNITSDTSITGVDGIFEFNNAPPGFYEIEVSKPGYLTETRVVSVASKNLQYAPFSLTGTPYPAISETLLDFDVDLTVQSFTIANIGKGELKYYFLELPDWITVTPKEGDVTTETDTVKVIIDRDKMPRKKIEESIALLSRIGDSWKEYHIDIVANRILYEGHYYGIVRIGTQIWFAENLNVGIIITRSSGAEPTPYDPIFGKVEKYCYDDDIENCVIYGGLYDWDEMMNWQPPDGGLIGTTQGICPEGWHIPTQNEFETLIEYLGGEEVAGGKLKAEGTIEAGTGFWNDPNEGATNESGFTGLPGGFYSIAFYPNYIFKGEEGHFWSSTKPGLENSLRTIGLNYIDTEASYQFASAENSLHSVRCIKDPE